MTAVQVSEDAVLVSQGSELGLGRRGFLLLGRGRRVGPLLDDQSVGKWQAWKTKNGQLQSWADFWIMERPGTGQTRMTALPCDGLSHGTSLTTLDIMNHSEFDDLIRIQTFYVIQLLAQVL